MNWIKKSERLPTPEDGLRVIIFSPLYNNDMRFRIIDFEFVRICDEATHWCKINEPL